MSGGIVDIRTGKPMTRRDFGRGIAAILASGVAPSVAPSVALGAVASAGSANASVGRGIMRNVGARNAAMFGVGKPTAKDYVQDGLIGMWDGIENAEYGTHDENAVIWKDLIGNNDLKLYGCTFDHNSCVALNNAQYAQSATFPSSIKTIEISFLNKGTGRCFLTLGSFKLWRWSSSQWCWYNRRSSGNSNNVLTTITDGSIHTATICFDNLDDWWRKFDIYSDASSSISYCNEYWSDKGFSVFRRTGDSAYQACYGNAYNIRAYSSYLSYDEVKYNYVIDKTRFNLA